MFRFQCTRSLSISLSVLAMLALVWQAGAQQPQKSSQELDGMKGQTMQCPMMKAAGDLKLNASSPEVILAMKDQLQLDETQIGKIRELIEETNSKAKGILDLDQQQKVSNSPAGDLSLMQVSKLIQQDSAEETKKGMCPMCMKVMQDMKSSR